MPDATFVDLTADLFPLTIRAFLEETDALVWEESIEGPGALKVPPLVKEYGGPVRIEIEYGNGHKTITYGNGETVSWTG